MGTDEPRDYNAKLYMGTDEPVFNVFFCRKDIDSMNLSLLFMYSVFPVRKLVVS